MAKSNALEMKIKRRYIPRTVKYVMSDNDFKGGEIKNKLAEEKGEKWWAGEKL